MSTEAAEADTRRLAELLARTADPAPAPQREDAERQISALQEVTGFAPALMRVLVYPEATASVRQSAAVYLKKLVVSNWHKLETEHSKQGPCVLPECNRALVRCAIVDATVHAPEPVRVQLCLSLKNIIKYDFPVRWTSVVDEILAHLQGADTTTWYGASLCLYQFITCYESETNESSYEKETNDKRAPFIEAMRQLLPAMQQLMERVAPDESEQASLLKKQLLKNFFGLVKYTLPLELISRETFSQWMEILCRLVDASIPPQTLEVNVAERLKLPWWKTKKWAVLTLRHLFINYGSTVTAREEYAEFAGWYLTTFTGTILEVLLKVLASHRAGEYVSPYVLRHTFSYINQCVSHAHSWNILKAHMFGIVQDIIFPLMCHSLEDEELWKNPIEYIRVKNDAMRNSHLGAGENLLFNCCSKRKEMLQQTMQLCMQVLTNQNGEYGPQQCNGALHMLGVLGDILVSNKLYKDQIDGLLTQHVFPQFNNPLGYLRARACWVLPFFFTNKDLDQGVLTEAVRLTVNTLLTDTDLPVKFAAAMSMATILSSQREVQKYVEPQITTIILELLKMIRETESDDLTSAMQKIVPLYAAQLTPMTVDICEHLASTFSGILESGELTPEKEFAITGVLKTIETVIADIEYNKYKEIMAEAEKIILRVVGRIFQQPIPHFYEEAVSLMYELCAWRVSEDMWKMLEVLYRVFEKEGFECFIILMPLLYHFVFIDTDAFVSNENRVLLIFNICKKVINSDGEGKRHIFAVKLLEVMVLQCNGRIDQYLPSFAELVLARLTRNVQKTEMRLMALQVLIAILYCNPILLFNIIEKLQESLPNASIAQNFIKQWIDNAGSLDNLHDRKICVLALCKLLEMEPASRPAVLDEVIGQIVPLCLIHLHGIKLELEMIKMIQRAMAEDNEAPSEEVEEDEEMLASDDDECLPKRAIGGSGDKARQAIKDYEDDDMYMTDYATRFDKRDLEEFVCFKRVLTGLSATEPEFYRALTGTLTEEQQKVLEELFLPIDEMESTRIE